MKYRNFAVATWSDDIVLSMSPEQKLIFIYLYTSPYTSSCGIFKISLRTAGFQLGYTNSPFESALKGLCAAFPDFVAYDEQTGEVALLQYPKQLLISATGKALAISQKEVESVESETLLKAMISTNSAGLSRPYLAQLRRLQMQTINNRNVNVLLDGDIVQVSVYQLDEWKKEIEIESKDILSFSDENDSASFLPEMVVAKRPLEEVTPPAAPTPAAEIVAYLNTATGRDFRHKTKPTQQAINARLADGYSIDDFKMVIDCKAAQWKDDAEMGKYLRPETLFTPAHFESYLQEAKHRPAVNADAHLKDLPELTPEQAEQYMKFILYISEHYPALWRSGCRVFSQKEYFDYLNNTSLPGLSYNLSAEEKRSILTRLMQALSASDAKRKKWATVWSAYIETMRQILNGLKPTEI
jgi:uncharacterized phage protein (TIGR02220 family)